MPRKAPNEVSYRPSAYYFRKALRESATVADARVIGLQAVRELEALKEWVRGQGMIPPRRFILNTEAEDKQLLEFTQSSVPPPSPEAA